MEDIPFHERAILRLANSIRENRYPVSDEFDIYDRCNQAECTLWYLASYVHDMMRNLPVEVYEHAVDQIDRRIKYLEETPVSTTSTEERKVA